MCFAGRPCYIVSYQVPKPALVEHKQPLYHGTKSLYIQVIIPQLYAVGSAVRTLGSELSKLHHSKVSKNIYMRAPRIVQTRKPPNTLRTAKMRIKYLMSPPRVLQVESQFTEKKVGNASAVMCVRRCQNAEEK